MLVTLHASGPQGEPCGLHLSPPGVLVAYASYHQRPSMCYSGRTSLMRVHKRGREDSNEMQRINLHCNQPFSLNMICSEAPSLAQQCATVLAFPSNCSGVIVCPHLLIKDNFEKKQKSLRRQCHLIYHDTFDSWIVLLCSTTKARSVPLYSAQHAVAVWCCDRMRRRRLRRPITQDVHGSLGPLTIVYGNNLPSVLHIW